MLMSRDEELNRLVREMGAHFIVSRDLTDTFFQLDPIIAKLGVHYRPLLETFKHSLGSLLSTVSIPFSLASASLHQSHFQRIHIAERIRAASREELEENPPTQEVLEHDAYRIAIERMREFTGSAEGKDAMTRGICGFLLSSLREGGLESASRELIQHGIILLWSALEVLFRDTFEVHLNENPSVAQTLISDPGTRKRFEAEKFSLETLVEYGFDLSTKLGSVLVSQRDFSDLPTVKVVYSVIFGSCSCLIKRLNEAELWLLYQRRHLFVHRRETWTGHTSKVQVIHNH